VTKDRFSYQTEKLSQARSALMAPHPWGEEKSFAEAFDYCTRAFKDFDVTQVKDENARCWIETIKRLKDTTNVQDPSGEGTWVDRARAMTEEEKREFSDAVDELASWFRWEFWSDMSAYE
jgi:hypothetical protein